MLGFAEVLDAWSQDKKNNIAPDLLGILDNTEFKSSDLDIQMLANAIAEVHCSTKEIYLKHLRDVTNSAIEEPVVSSYVVDMRDLGDNWGLETLSAREIEWLFELSISEKNPSQQLTHEIIDKMWYDMFFQKASGKVDCDIAITPGGGIALLKLEHMYKTYIEALPNSIKQDIEEFITKNTA